MGPMVERNHSDLPDDVIDVARHLEAQKHEPSPLTLDELKRRTMSQVATARPRRGVFMRSKLVTLLLVSGLAISGGTAGVIAGVGGSSGKSSAGKSQYVKPGKGCGDRNHVHTGPPGNPSNTQCPPQSGPKK